MDKSDLSRALEALTAEKSELETQLCALKQNISSLVGKKGLNEGVGKREKKERRLFL